MSESSSILRMQQAIIDYIEANMPEDPNRARIGTVKGKRVLIGNKSYPFNSTVDMYFGEGSQVYCLLPDKGNRAAVVGVR